MRLVGGVEVADIHFHAGFDAMRAYTSKDNDRPDRASRPYAADRAGFVFSEGAGILVLETRAGAEARVVMGMALLGGMTLATVLGVFFYPMLFVFIGKIGRYEEKRSLPGAE